LPEEFHDFSTIGGSFLEVVVTAGGDPALPFDLLEICKAVNMQLPA
jgi:hypothetical protein